MTQKDADRLRPQIIFQTCAISRLAAVVRGGQIYMSFPNTTIGTACYHTGAHGTAIELQYIGSGQFLPIGHEGTITGF